MKNVVTIWTRYSSQACQPCGFQLTAPRLLNQCQRIVPACAIIYVRVVSEHSSVLSLDAISLCGISPLPRSQHEGVVQFDFLLNLASHGYRWRSTCSFTCQCYPMVRRWFLSQTTGLIRSSIQWIDEVDPNPGDSVDTSHPVGWGSWIPTLPAVWAGHSAILFLDSLSAILWTPCWLSYGILVGYPTFGLLVGYPLDSLLAILLSALPMTAYKRWTLCERSFPLIFWPLFTFFCAFHGTCLDPTLAPKGTRSRARRNSTLVPLRHWLVPPGHVKGTRSSSVPVDVQRPSWYFLLVSSRHWHVPPGHVRGTRSSSLPVGIRRHSSRCCPW